MTKDLFVDTGRLGPAGIDMGTSAGEVPLGPPPFTAPGTDPISVGINGVVPGLETPVIEGLNNVTAAGTTTGKNISAAAGKYEETDQTLADKFGEHRFENQGGPGGGPGHSGAAAQNGATAAASPAGDMGQFGQLMSMPMQMAAQAVQIPMQMVGMAAAIPQGVMQGMQSVMQGFGQSPSMGAKDSGSLADSRLDPTTDQSSSEKTDSVTEHEGEGAGPGQQPSQRVPQPDMEKQQPAPQAAPVRPPAPTRPAEAVDGIEL